MEKPVEEVLSYLVLNHLAGRRYFREPTAVNGQQSGVEATVNGDTDTPYDEDKAPLSLEKMDELDRVELEKIVNR